MNVFYIHMRTLAHFQDSENAPTYIVHLTTIPRGHKGELLAIYTNATLDCAGDCFAAGAYKFGIWSYFDFGSVTITWDGDSVPTTYNAKAYDLFT